MSLLARVTRALRRRPPDTPESRRIQMALLEAQRVKPLIQPERRKRMGLNGWFSD